VPSAAITTPATADYCRKARRIRASFDRAPLLRHQALKDLARERNLQLLVNPAPARLASVPMRRASTTIEARPLGTAANRDHAVAVLEASENEFAVAAAAKLQPFGFTFSDRIKLLDLAERSGISRFRANVILATHEHQVGGAGVRLDLHDLIQ
jgi:hypothetical protein